MMSPFFLELKMKKSDKEEMIKTIRESYVDYGSSKIIAIEKLYGCYDYLPYNKDSYFNKKIEEECEKYKKTREDYNGN